MELARVIAGGFFFAYDESQPFVSVVRHAILCPE
jgi:hypothetical protein